MNFLAIFGSIGYQDRSKNWSWGVTLTTPGYLVHNDSKLYSNYVAVLPNGTNDSLSYNLRRNTDLVRPLGKFQEARVAFGVAHLGKKSQFEIDIEINPDLDTFKLSLQSRIDTPEIGVLLKAQKPNLK